MELKVINIGSKTLHVFFMLIILPLLYTSALYSQAQIGGVINSYAAVESIESQNSVRVNDPGQFQPGDTVLLIQMKGLGIDINPGSYGVQQDINNAGNYEFLLIDFIDNNIITFTRNFLKQYNAVETAQLIKVNGYESARVTSTLQAKEWDRETGTGGVISLIVTNTLTLEADIDASGSGFKGGIPVDHTNGVCSGNDIVNEEEYEKFSFPEGIDISGRKGDGPATYYIEGEDIIEMGSGFIQGKGRIASGGGSGNGLFAGGGGGGNYSPGGFGGRESDACPLSAFETEGYGGSGLANQMFTPGGEFLNRFFMGGGGGGSTQFGDRQASKGGDGGGIIIIIANYIEGTEDYGIYADGESVTGIATAGAGGGGGGGTIVASIDNYLGEINMHTQGGKGGDVNYHEMAGPGGGGGEGTIIHSGAGLPATVNTFISFGSGGTNIQQNDNFGSTNGSPASLENIVNNLEVSLNGILFNGIRTHTSTICEDVTPDLIEGTLPRGQVTPYEFEWLKRPLGSAEWTTIQGAGEKNYPPDLLSEDTQFRRVVKDNTSPVVIDSSNILTITVQPKITDNIISQEQTICEGETPLALTEVIPVQGGTGEYAYTWIQSLTTSGEWTEPGNENNQANYSPPALHDSTFFRRIVTSGVCIDSSDIIIPVNVHPAIKNNILSDDQTICNGDAANPVFATGDLAGGLGPGEYTYAWEEGSDNTWIPVDDNGSSASYEPGILTGTISYRRIVESGECQDTSSPHTIIVLDNITGNTISGDQTICYLESPELFEGAEPGGGDGNFIYNWEITTDEVYWTLAENNNENIDYLSPPLSETSSFRRIVYSGPDNECKDTSNLVHVSFHPLSYGEILEATDTICTGEGYELRINLSGEAPWEWILVFSDGQEQFTVDDIEETLHIEPVNPETPDSTTFSYQIVSLTDKFGCSVPEKNITGTATVRVYAFPTPDAGFDREVCGPVIELNAVPSFGSGYWLAESASAQFSTDTSDPNAMVTVDNYDTHRFWWTETNWQCAETEEVSITNYEQPVNVFAGSDQHLQFFFETYMEAELPANMQDVRGFWELVSGNGYIYSQGDPNTGIPGDPNTMVTDLALGENILRWTVINGVCEAVSDQVKIIINDLDPPSGFSPNNSGLNDRFIIRGLENSLSNELTIFNRQGNVVYRAVNYQNDWEGRNQSGVPLPEDTYYYILSVDDHFSYKGFIVLKRY